MAATSVLLLADGVGRDGAAALPVFSSRASSRLAATSSLGYDLSRAVEDDLGALPPLSRDVLAGGTEPANQGETACGLYFEQLRPIFREKRPAIFATALGSLQGVFALMPTLRSHSGWPAFRRPIAPDHIILKPDGDTAFMGFCARSGMHLATACRRLLLHQRPRRWSLCSPVARCRSARCRGARGHAPPVLAAVLGGNLVTIVLWRIYRLTGSRAASDLV